jgi:deoxyuridine 5'-triphosphate nucleotidohydrolase
VIKVPTDIAIKPPPGTYCQILSRSGLVTKHNVKVKAVMIDTDYTGNITAILYNNSDVNYQIHKGDRVAQVLIYNITQPTIQETSELAKTQRGNQGFGHSGISIVCNVQNREEQLSSDTLEWTLQDVVTTEGIKPYNICFSPDPSRRESP